MSLSSHIRVAVLRGGNSLHYDASFDTGAAILKSLPEQYEGIDVIIDQSGVWHLGGLPKSPAAILHQVDAVWNALHGYHPDVAAILHLHNVPHVGDTHLPRTFFRHISKQYSSHAISVPVYELLHKSDYTNSTAREVFNTFPNPLIIRVPEHNVYVASRPVYTLKDLAEAIERGFSEHDLLALEEYIPGNFGVVGVIEKFRDTPVYTLPMIEIKSGGDYRMGSFSEEQKKKATDVARLIHELSGVKDFSESYFVVHPKRGVLLTDTISTPSLGKDSSFRFGLDQVGASFPDFLEQKIRNARMK